MLSVHAMTEYERLSEHTPVINGFNSLGFVFSSPESFLCCLSPRLVRELDEGSDFRRPTGGFDGA